MADDLLKELTEKRDELRARPTLSGKQPKVCTDEALESLARFRPKTKKELLYVPGLGKAFEEKYGDEFIEILSKYHAAQVKNREVMQPHIKARLEALEARLVNINRRNRLLYMPKLSAKYAVDLVGSGSGSLAGFKVVELLKKQDGKQQLKILDLKEVAKNRIKEAEKRYTEFKTLARESERARRESGESTLHVGYPFVQGKLSGEDFAVRAPLVLFPAKLTLTPDAVYLSLETEKDVVYNSALILAQYKFAGKSDAVDNNTVEEIRPYKFLDDIVEYFKAHDMTLKKPVGSDVTPFVSYTADAFPKYRRGQLEICENAVIGSFSLYSGALQQDFRRIIESDSINEQLNELLVSADEKDIYSDSEQLGDMPDITPPTEKSLNYINELNISQENAIYNINNSQRLVVQGPPGTGKSQLITSMIADFVNKGKNVLMVSQKKAALDVIYSRLGKLSRYAVMIADTKDKEPFYESVSRLFAVPGEKKFDMTKFDGTSERIDEGLSRLEHIADKMFFEEPFGAPMYYIYGSNSGNRFLRERTEVIDKFECNIPKELAELDYDDIVDMRDYFDDRELLASLREYYALNDSYPWLAWVKADLDAVETARAIEDAESVVDEYVAFKSMGAFKRLFGGGKYRAALKATVKKYLTGCDGRTLSRLKKDPTELYNGLKNYERYRMLKIGRDRLSDMQKLYFGCLYNVGKEREGELSELNREMKDYIAYRDIVTFESENRDVIAALDTFDITVRDISNLLKVKKHESIDRMRSTLASDFAEYIDGGKNKSEMMRALDGKRKPGIRRFVEKFAFWLFKGLKVWLMTPEAVSEVLPLEDGLFDLVIFDEASQIYIERGVPAIARAKKVVIAGDHKQLRPSSLGDGRIGADEDGEDDDAALEEESLLDLARFRYPEVMLDYHYRSRYEELIAFSNYAFYKGRLNISPNTEQCAEPPISVTKVKNGRWEDRRNMAEAKEVVALLKGYLSDESRTETLGVITFNSNQRDLVQDLIDKECTKNPAFAAAYAKEAERKEKGEDVGLFVKNIENVQGDERDIIIFSIAYAKDESGKVVRNYGWLNRTGGENRLNVAISRAKRKIHIITSITPDELKVDDLKNDGPKFFRKYLEYAYAVSGNNTAAALAVLESLSTVPGRSTEHLSGMVGEVYNALVQAGFNVERDVGMGRYKIDIAIKDENSRYILGLECDDGLYSRLPSARERDVHRARYLESRGWKLKRIWSAKWWHDPKGEVEKIRAAVKERLQELYPD